MSFAAAVVKSAEFSQIQAATPHNRSLSFEEKTFELTRMTEFSGGN